MTNWITGDKHGSFDKIFNWVHYGKIKKYDTVIILGDSGINYHKESNALKNKLNGLDINIFVIHGNHEERATCIDTYKVIDFLGGKVSVEKEYPNLIFAIDGETYDFDGKKCIAIGGAYSVDKFYRLAIGANWWENEQPSEEIKHYVEQQLIKDNWNVDYVFSHTCPYKFMPTEWFLNCIEQNEVDNSTELWLDYIHNKLNYNMWYCGHFHGDKFVDKANLRFMYNDIIILGGV